jgi:dTDP-4-amino-4,6-dideoxygalactose transaminase
MALAHLIESGPLKSGRLINEMTAEIDLQEGLQVPFFRAQMTQLEIDEVNDTLRSGWLTTGPKVKRFENEFAAAVGARHAVAVNSCTAALHLAVEAMGLKAGQAVLVPTMTFAATAEVIRYMGALPVLVDCDPITGNMNLEDAARKLTHLRSGNLLQEFSERPEVVGIIPVHVGGLMLDLEALDDFASQNELWVIEDAAHAFPSAWRRNAGAPWRRCGEGTANISCFSFYANKTITTGEGGMAVTNDSLLAERMRLMSLHGLSKDAWARYSGGGSWDYKIMAPGFKYNLTDIAAAIGIHQLARAETMRKEREEVAQYYFEEFRDVEQIELPLQNSDRIHSWHLFPIRLRLESLAIGRDLFMEQLKNAGVGCSVHWRPLHLHPYYQLEFGWQEASFPVATDLWERVISLPIFPAMSKEELQYVVDVVKTICLRNSLQIAQSRTA